MSNYESKQSYEGEDKCPDCGNNMSRDEVDIGVGIQYGHLNCGECGWGDGVPMPVEPKQIYDGYMNDASPVPRTAAEFGQPAPIPNDKPALWPMVIEDFENYCTKEVIRKTPHLSSVIADMNSRDQFGRKKYGVPLQMHNGRNAINDAYEELLDGAVYLKQAIQEGTNSNKNRSEIVYLKKAYEHTFQAIAFMSSLVKR